MAISYVGVKPGPVETRTADNYWMHRRAVAVRPIDRFVLILFLVTGLGVTMLLADWWFREVHVNSVPLFVTLSIAFWYSISRVVVGWVNYAGIKRPLHQPAPDGLRVAIFTTSSPGEPLAMFEKTLAACARIEYPHTTYLLDDTRDPRFRELAERHGAVWLELLDLPGAKAGKINRALELTDEEFILVMDPDHVPFSNFLDRVLGPFDDPEIGFVQVCQAYYNQDRSFVARAAAEQTYQFYGPTQMGLFGHGGCVAIGANCTFRRSALQSIGGHGIGLAEDLVTSIRLHAEGWQSVYVPEVVSRGLVPEDLGSFYKQQLKWARGVYEVAFSELPRLFARLTWRQRLSYAAIGTYYFFGVTTLIYLVIPYLYLWGGLQPAAMQFSEFVTKAAPVALLGSGIYLYAQRWLCHPFVERGLHWRGMILKMACWPVFLAGTLLAVVRASIPYIPTAKEAAAGQFWKLASPHIGLVAAFVLTSAWVIVRRFTAIPEVELMLTSEAVWGMIFFASIAVFTSCGAIYAAWSSRKVPEGQPWETIQLDKLHNE
jgi:cellulose synthase (UDP-forming)